MSFESESRNRPDISNLSLELIFASGGELEETFFEESKPLMIEVIQGIPGAKEALIAYLGKFSSSD